MYDTNAINLLSKILETTDMKDFLISVTICGATLISKIHI